VKSTDRFRTLLAAGLLLVLLMPGCGRFLSVFAPRTKTVKAEFNGLKHHSVAVVIFTDETTQYQYPWVALNLSALISTRLSEKVRGIRVVDPQKVSAYQRENLRWVELDRTALGKALDADLVLYVSLVEFSTVEAGYVDLLRGRINGEVKLYDSSKPERDACIWFSDRNIRTMYPKTPTVRTGDNETHVRSVILGLFSEQVARNFYSYKIDRDAI